MTGNGGPGGIRVRVDVQDGRVVFGVLGGGKWMQMVLSPDDARVMAVQLVNGAAAAEGKPVTTVSIIETHEEKAGNDGNDSADSGS